MAHAIQLSTLKPAESIGLEVWMHRVIERADIVADTWDADAVHDLRVGLRRCRTIVEAIDQVNPDSKWRKIKRASRDLFHSLGLLRDTQVERLWVKKLWPPRHATRTFLLHELSAREKAQQASTKDALDTFDRKTWKKWTRKVGPKATYFPTESVVYRRLAFAALNDCAAALEKARKRSSASAWHRARIALKHFRYIGENFLPREYKEWAENIKHLQDLLGDVHDLDVLLSDVRKIARRGASKVAMDAKNPWLEKFQTERHARLAEVVTRITGRTSLLLKWRSDFHWAQPVSVVATERERRTA